MNPAKPRSRSSIAALSAIVLALAFCASPIARAQDFPSKTVRLIVLTSPGGGPDLTARLLMQPMESLLGKPVVVENKAGGGGVAGILDLLNSPADGHTILVPDASHWAIYPLLTRDAPYDGRRDFAPIGLIWSAPLYLAAQASAPFKDVRELVALVRAKPGTLNYGAANIGGVVYLLAETFRRSLALEIAPVSYKGGSDTNKALLSGEVLFGWVGYTSALNFVSSGKLKLLAVSSATRFPLTPDIPTAAEAANLPGFDFTAQLGLVARTGTPRPIMDKLSTALLKSLDNPEVKAGHIRLGLELTPTTPDKFEAIIRADIEKYAKAIKLAGLRQQ